jgi:hypothetical protein
MFEASHRPKRNIRLASTPDISQSTDEQASAERVLT